MIRKLWTGFASIETTLELWASSPRDVKRRTGRLFAQERGRTGWMRAEAAGDPAPGRDRWDADELRDLVCEYGVEHLADNDAVRVIDETGFLKQGNASCGMARQYTGSAGKIANCQIGMFAAYVSRHGHAFVDRALYLPKAWRDGPARLKAASVPRDIGFATKPRLAARMIARAVAADVPFRWVAADCRHRRGDRRGIAAIRPAAPVGRRGDQGPKAA